MARMDPVQMRPIAKFRPSDIKSANGVSLLRQQLFTTSQPTIAGVIADDAAGKASHNAIDARAYDFDGTDDYVSFPHISAYNITEAITVCAWICLDTFGQTERILDKSFSTAWAFALEDTAPYDGLAVYLNGTKRLDTGTGLLTATTWHHVAFTYDRTNLIIYVDGVSVASTTGFTAAIGTNSTAISFGREAAGGGRLDGKVFDLRLYSQALTVDEIAHVMSFGLSGDDPGATVLHAKCDDNHPSVSFDSSEYGNHGVKTNITDATFHYTGRDVPWSFPNESGHSRIFSVVNPQRILAIPAADLVGKTSSTLTFDVRIDPSDTTGQVFGSGGAIGGRFPIYLSGGANSLSVNTPHNSFLVDGVLVTTNGGVYDAISDGEWHECQALGINFTVTGWTTNGLWVSNFSSSSNSNNMTGDVRNLTLDGVVYDSQIIPRDESDPTNDVLGNSLQYSGRAKIPGQAIEANCFTADGVDDYIAAAHLVGTETVVSSGGTSTPTISAGRIDFTAGTCWNLLLSDGTSYPLAEGGGATVYDVSDGGNNGTITNATTTPGAGCWANTQDSYHRNLSNGFELYDDDATGLLFIRVPYLDDGSKITPTISGYTKVRDNDAGKYHNSAESTIDMTGGVLIADSESWEDDAAPWAFNDARSNPLFARSQTSSGVDVRADRMLAFRETLSGTDLTKVQSYTADKAI